MTTPLLTTGVDPAPLWTRTDYLLVGVLVLVGLALRIPGLNYGLWIDEIVTLFSHARSPVPEIIGAADSSNNHVLYSLCAHYVVAWLGEAPWTVRLPAVVFGVAGIPALYHLGRQFAGREEAFLATLFMVLNYQFIWYSQSARGYTGLLLGAVLATILFIRLITTRRSSPWLIAAYALVAAMSAWIHLTAVFVMLAHGLIWLALTSRQPGPVRPATYLPTFIALLLAGLFTLALYAPLVGVKYDEVEMVSTGAGDSVLVPDRSGSAAAALKWAVEEYAQGLQRSIPGGWPVVVIVAFVLLTGIGSYFRQSLAIAGLLLLPVLLTSLVILLSVHYFFPRYLFGSAGFLLLFAVRGGFVAAGMFLPFLSRRQVLLIGSLIALAGVAFVPAAWQPKQDFVGAAGFIQEHRSPGDAVVCMTQAAFVLETVMEVDCDPVKSLAELIQIETQHERTWLIYTLPGWLAGVAPEVWQRIQHSPDYVKIKEFPGTLNGGDIIVVLKQTKPQADSQGPDANS